MIGYITLLSIGLCIAWFASFIVASCCFIFSLLTVLAAVDGGYGEEKQISDLKDAGKLFLAGIAFTGLLLLQGYFGCTAIMGDEIHKLIK